MNSFIRNYFFLGMNFIAWIRRIRFQLQVNFHNGSLKMADSVRFDHPVRYQGSGNLEIADSVVFGYWLAGAVGDPILLQPRDPSSTIFIGRSTSIVNGCELIARKLIHIGENCRIGPRCIFLDSDFHGIGPKDRGKPGKSASIIIGNNVWIGSEVMILKGVKVGDDVVIGARSVVTKDVSDGAIVAGNPARIIGSVYD